MDAAKLIDHTLLSADADESRVKQLCDEARRFKFRAVMVQPCRVGSAVEYLLDSGIDVGTVAGFPFGANDTATKVAEAARAVLEGATDIDMVINIGWLKDGRWERVKTDIGSVVESGRGAAAGRKVTVKVIIEACLLSDKEKETAAAAVVEAGADYVKTSTGYLGPGANAYDVALLRKAVGPDFGVKASGGVRTLAQLRELANAGANRIGTSAGVAIMKEG